MLLQSLLLSALKTISLPDCPALSLVAGISILYRLLRYRFLRVSRIYPADFATDCPYTSV